MLSAFVAIALFADSQAPMPPYRRLDTTVVFKDSYRPESETDGSLFLSVSFGECVAYDLRTMKRIWKVAAPKNEAFETLSLHAGKA